MFGLSVEKLLVLAVVALFVLGPERLPAAAAWLGRAVHHVNGIISDAQTNFTANSGLNSISYANRSTSCAATSVSCMHCAILAAL